MGEKSLLGIIKLPVTPDKQFDETQEQEVLNLALFLSLLNCLLLFALFLPFCLNLLFNLDSLSLSDSGFLVALLLALSRSQVIIGCGAASLGRTLILLGRLLSRVFRFSGCTSEVVLRINVLNTIVETAILSITSRVYGDSGFLLRVSRLLVILGLILGSCLLVVGRGAGSTSLIDACKLTELGVADLAVGVVVTTAQDSFNILPPWVEAVSLEVADQIWHRNGTVALSNCVKDAHLDKFRRVGKLTLRLTTLTLQLHLFVEETREEGKHFIGKRSTLAEVG